MLNVTKTLDLIFSYFFNLLLLKFQTLCRHTGFIKLNSLEDTYKEVVWRSFSTNTCSCETPFTGYLIFGCCFHINNANAELNKKESEVIHYLKEMCNRKIFFLSKKIKTSHLKSSTLHLTRKEANILSSSLPQHISKVFNFTIIR